MHKFIEEDLIQFLYNETAPEKSNQIRVALETDWALEEKYQLLLCDFQKLDSISLKPKENSIKGILNYAEKAIEEFSTST